MGRRDARNNAKIGRTTADAEDAEGDGQYGQGRDGVTDVEDLHEAFCAPDHVRSAEQDTGGDAHNEGRQHGH